MNNTVSIGFDGALYQLIFFNKVPSIFARSHYRTSPGSDSKPRKFQGDQEDQLKNMKLTNSLNGRTYRFIYLIND